MPQTYMSQTCKHKMHLKIEKKSNKYEIKKMKKYQTKKEMNTHLSHV